MSASSRPCLAALVCLLAASSLPAQNLPDRAVDLVPVRPTTQAELDHLEAVGLYGSALLKQSANCLLEAARLFEDSLRLEPDSLPVMRALVPLYFALDRVEDGCRTCDKILTLDKDDFATALVYSRHLRALSRPRDALEVLENLTKSAKVKERPEARCQVYYELGTLSELQDENARAESAFRILVGILEEPGPLVEAGPFSREELLLLSAETYERLGRLCLKLNKSSQAITDFEKSRQKDPARSARLAFNMAEVLSHDKKPAEALERLQEYLRTQPSGIEPYEMRIELQRQLAKTAEIVPSLEADCAREKHNIALQLILAREYRKAGRSDAAEATYQRLIDDSESNPAIYRGLFDTFREREGPGTKRAFELLDQTLRKASGEDARGPNRERTEDAAAAAKGRAMLAALREDPVLVKSLLVETMNQLKGPKKPGYTTRSSLAYLALRTKQLDIAEALYRNCLEEPGGPDETIEHDIYAGLLMILEQAHKYKEIAKLCQRGLKEAAVTNRLMLRLELAHALAALERTKEALEQIETCVAEAPNTEVLRCRLSRAQMKANAGDTKAGIDECQELLKEYNQPKEVRSIRLMLSNLYSLKHDMDRSEEQLKLILEVDPNDATANNDLGYQWADQSKELEQAEKLIRKAIELDREQRNSGTSLGADAGEDTAAYVDSLGWVLFRRGKLDEARKELEKASVLPDGADDPVVWDHLGDVLFRLNQLNKARDCWRKALKLYDAGVRRKTDGRYNDIKEKFEQQEP